jgi:2-iminobutanoate/2-iminopropanoate deaminase
MQSIKTDDAPKAIGPYSQGVAFKELLFVSGQIAINPKTGNIEAASIEDQTRQVLGNLQAILSAGGSDLNRVLKCTVFLASMEDFAAFNKIYGEYFGEAPPARSTVQVARLPRDARVEIDVIAYRVT